MENNPDKNLFREVHRKVRDIRDKAQKNRADVVQRSQKAAKDEAQKEGFDRPSLLPEDESQ